ncbi:MAG: serine hydrolase domain-containing protein [Pseudomonadota bacterium]
MNLFRPIAASIALISLAVCTAQANDSAPAVATVPGEAAMLKEFMARQQSGQTTSLLFYSTEERRVAFKHIDRILPTRKILVGDSPYPLGEKLMDLSGVTYEVDGKSFSVADFLAMPSQIGFLAVKDGNVVMEHYAAGNDRNSRWVSFSVSKSVTSMLIGAAIKDGFINSVDEPVAHYLPRLRGTGYEGASIKDVLQMSSGVAWNEDYADPQSDVAQAGGANGIQLVSYLGKLEKQHEPGEVFNYNTGETNLVGEILRAAIGNNAATYATHKIWQPFGMESDANWLTGGPGAGETGGCCISATLRDYARIGLFAMKNGKLRDGTKVLPDNWIKESTSPSKGAEYYGYLWWLNEDSSYAARGIFGQQIYIDSAANVVIAAHSNAPAAVGTDYHKHLAAAIQAVGKRLK